MSPCPLCLFIWVVTLVAFPFSEAFGSIQEVRYQEQTGDDSFVFVWQLEKEPEEVTLTVTQRQKEEVFVSVNTPQGGTLSWHYTRTPDIDIRVERTGNFLVYSGVFEGKKIDKREKIDKRPWYQPLSFSLRCMEERQEDTVSFWTVRPDNLEALTLQAKRGGSGRLLESDGKEVWANKVVIRLEGLLSAIWSAEYWFRKDDNLFVRYRGTHGPPGVPETRISLLSP
nr:hypothetical protein [uncultured Desulfobulbus sp.]